MLGPYNLRPAAAFQQTWKTCGTIIKYFRLKQFAKLGVSDVDQWKIRKHAKSSRESSRCDSPPHFLINFPILRGRSGLDLSNFLSRGTSLKSRDGKRKEGGTSRETYLITLGPAYGYYLDRWHTGLSERVDPRLRERCWQGQAQNSQILSPLCCGPCFFLCALLLWMGQRGKGSEIQTVVNVI